MKELPPVVLASASPRRSELLHTLGIPFSVIVSDADEVHDSNLTLRELCQLNAYRKARVVAKKHPDCLVLGADTLVCLGAKVYGKPANLDEARTFLRELSGDAHEVVTGVCLLHLRSHYQRVFAVTSVVVFRTLTQLDVEKYISTVNVLDKAGAYGIQECGDLIIEDQVGSYSNIVGLPLERLNEELDSFQERI